MATESSAKKRSLLEAIEYVDAHKWINNKDRTRMKNNALRVLNLIGDKRLGEINQNDLTKLREKVLNQGLSVKTFEHYYYALSSTFTGNGLAPLPRIDRDQEEQPPRIISGKEEEQLFKILEQQKNQEMIDFCILLADTGLNPDEAVKMSLNNVNLAKRVILLPGKRDLIRSIKMTQRVYDVISRRQKENPEKLFKYQVSYYQRAFKKTREAMGLGDDKLFTLKAFRQTLVDRQGVTDKTIDALDIKHPVTIQRYINSVDKGKQ